MPIFPHFVSNTAWSASPAVRYSRSGCHRFRLMYSPMSLPEPPSMKNAVLCSTGSLSSAAGGCASRYFAHSSWAGVIFVEGVKENGEVVGNGDCWDEAGKEP